MRRRILLGLIILSTLMAGCDSSEERARLSAPVLIGTWDAIQTLDPHQVHSRLEIMVASSLYLGLVKYDLNGQIVPGLAQSWNVSPDGKTYIFRLRKSTWNNGKPITSETFERSLKRHFTAKRPGPWLKYLADIENAAEVRSGRLAIGKLGVRALSPDILEIRLRQPQPALLSVLATPAGAPVQDARFMNMIPAKFPLRQLSVNGPYKIESVTANKIKLIPNYTYVLPGFEKRLAIDIRQQFDAAKSMSAFLGGEYSVLDAGQLPPDVIQSKGKLRDQFIAISSHRAVGLKFNLSEGPLKQESVRRAISMLINRSELPQRLPTAQITPSMGLIPLGLTGYSPPALPDWAAWTLPQRQAEATRLLAEAGFGSTSPLKLKLRNTTSTQYRIVAAWLVEILKPFNIIVDVGTNNSAADIKDSGQVVIFTWETLIDSPEALLNDFGCPSVSGGKIACDPQLQTLLVDAGSSSNLAERNTKFRQIERLLLQSSFVATLYEPITATLVSPDLSGWPVSSTLPPAFERLQRKPRVLR
jgi:oligopeptide transport system substrate-binding protein